MDFTFLSHPLFIAIVVVAILELYFFAHGRYIDDVCSKHFYSKKLFKLDNETKLYSTLMVIVLGIGFILIIAAFFVFEWKAALLIVVVKFIFLAAMPVPNKLLYPKTTKEFEKLFSQKVNNNSDKPRTRHLHPFHVKKLVQKVVTVINIVDNTDLFSYPTDDTIQEYLDDGWKIVSITTHSSPFTTEQRYNITRFFQTFLLEREEDDIDLRPIIK